MPVAITWGQRVITSIVTSIWRFYQLSVFYRALTSTQFRRPTVYWLGLPKLGEYHGASAAVLLRLYTTETDSEFLTSPN